MLHAAAHSKICECTKEPFSEEIFCNCFVSRLRFFILRFISRTRHSILLFVDVLKVLRWMRECRIGTRGGKGERGGGRGGGLLSAIPVIRVAHHIFYEPYVPLDP